ncbi:MAG TPA: hypothetical protein VEY92_03720, partial [Pseudoxanthomonas sp.]|nr:hypothetical protein [Pseudoxanthomonas sp.]
PPPDSNPGGASTHMTRHIPFELTRVSDVEYRGTVYADGLLAYQGDPELAGASRARVPAAALQVPTEQSVAQFSQVDLAVQLAQQDQQRRRQEREAQASQGPTMG